MPLSDYTKWNPGIYKGGTFYQLPRPVQQLQIVDAWKFDESKIPLKDGVSISGHSLDGVRIRAGGSVSKDEDGDAVLTEIAMFDAYKDFRAVADLSSTDSAYEFIIYDDGSSVYRKFKDVWPVNLSCEIGDDSASLFKWSGEWIAEDTTIYTTAPGS